LIGILKLPYITGLVPQPLFPVKNDAAKVIHCFIRKIRAESYNFILIGVRNQCKFGNPSLFLAWLAFSYQQCDKYNL
jgi:hypothetical protein